MTASSDPTRGMFAPVDPLRRARRTALDASGSGTELALRDRRSVVDAFVDEHFNLHGVRSRVDGGGDTAKLAGLTAGLQASTGEPTVATDRLQLEAR